MSCTNALCMPGLGCALLMPMEEEGMGKGQAEGRWSGVGYSNLKQNNETFFLKIIHHIL